VCRKAVDAQHATAEYNFAQMLYNGYRGPVDKERARRYWELAAKKGMRARNTVLACSGTAKVALPRRAARSAASAPSSGLSAA
jgi:TPR repeat protein